MEFLLIGLLGLGVAGMIFDYVDDSDRDDDTAEPPPDPDQRFEVESGDTVTAGDGNDTITAADSITEEMITSIDAGEGDDLITIGDDYVASAELSGDAGNDTISGSLWPGLLIDGGSGDDVLSGGGKEAVLLGGTGNDIVNLDYGRSDEPAFANGGEGNDTMTYEGAVEQEFFSSGPRLVGGEGDDVFQLTLTKVNAPITDPSDPSFGSSARVVGIGDFSVGNDQLIIDLSQLAAEAPAFGDFELVERNGFTEIVLRFDNGANGIIALSGVTGLSSADISVTT